MEYRRDLLYVARTTTAGAGFAEQEIAGLHQLLGSVETLQKLCACSEIIDLAVFHVLRDPARLRDLLRKSELKPFQFLFNKN